jgi:glutaredoxin 3
MNVPNVEIYTIPTCSDCNDAKRFFREHNIAYIDYNCEEDPKYAEEVWKLTRKQIVPTIKIGDQVFIGFSANYEEIQKLLQVTNS